MGMGQPVTLQAEIHSVPTCEQSNSNPGRVADPVQLNLDTVTVLQDPPFVSLVVSEPMPYSLSNLSSNYTLSTQSNPYFMIFNNGMQSTVQNSGLIPGVPSTMFQPSFTPQQHSNCPGVQSQISALASSVERMEVVTN